MSLFTKTRYPGVSVILYKNVGRQKLSGSGTNALPVSTRFSEQQSTLDVTQYLGERGAVNVNKSIRSPAGVFSIDFTDQLVQLEDDSIYGLFEPMDVIEIRMVANRHAGAMPIMMRGFISAVTRSQSMGQDGRPTRKVTVSGQDYGKIWQILNIYYNPWMPDGQNYITQFKLFTRFGIAFQTETAGNLIRDVMSKIVNPFITKMGALAGASATLMQFKTDIQTQGGAVAPFGANDWQGGSVYALLQSFGDVGPWNELYVEDRADAPYVVFRPNPYIKAGGDPSNSGSYINGNSTKAAVTSIDTDSVLGMEVSRTDSNVANYFWVECAQYDMNFGFVGKAMAVQGGAPSTFIVDYYGNNDPKLYGFKRMAESTNQGAFGQKGGGGTDKTTNLQDASASSSWIGARRASLVEQNKDNVILEHGSIRLIGNENVKAGTYISLTHGNMISHYYVSSVSHSFTPFGAYTTSATVERGTGFIDRAQKGAAKDSPYWAELADSQK